MSVTLSDAITNHRIQDFSKIGTRNWTYLSWDWFQGWDVIKFEGFLGVFQQFFRKLGFYSSTHLKTIAHRIEVETDVPQALLNKIRACWQKKGYSAMANEEAIFGNRRVGKRIERTILLLEQGRIEEVRDIDAIVCPTNEACLGMAGGVDSTIHVAAGPELLDVCDQLPQIQPDVRCLTGGAVITGPAKLSEIGIRKIIHAVGPDMRADPLNPEVLLRNAYLNSLELARKHGLRRVAFPPISAFRFHYPFRDAISLAFQTIQGYLRFHSESFDEIRLMVVSEDRWREAAGLLAPIMGVDS